MTRSRRAFLAAVGASAAVAGCAARAPSKTPQYTMSVRTPHGAEDPFDFEVNVRRPTATRRSPLALRVTYRNTREADTYRELHPQHSWTRYSAGDEPAIAFACSNSRHEQATPGCWTPADGGIGALLVDVDLSDLPAGTTIHLDYEVWGLPADRDADGSLQPATYRVPMEFGLGVELELDVENG